MTSWMFVRDSPTLEQPKASDSDLDGAIRSALHAGSAPGPSKERQVQEVVALLDRKQEASRCSRARGKK